uniref:Diacylglycerol kinase n=1 Tax=Echeneis naucrates TaxID=173247 RepID=A0A665UZT9_ECHNA
ADGGSVPGQRRWAAPLSPAGGSEPALSEFVWGDMADSGRARPADSDGPDGRTGSPSSAPGHCFKRVTLTKPTFCHSCSDFIWGLIGFLCEVCNLMCHEKCLKTLRSVCSCMMPSAVRVPVAHCFGPAGQKKRFCCVCRKQTEGNTALRCEVCELHVHADCAAFCCADCRSCHLDTTLEQDMFPHHWREGNLPSAAKCEVCRRSCSSSDILTGMRCEWCGITVRSHAACYLSLPPECILGRLRCMLLHPACVQLDSRNFSKMHCYRIAESCSQELGTHTHTVKDSPRLKPEPSNRNLKVFDGDDAVKRSCFRPVSIFRSMNNEDVVEAALRAFYLPGDPQDFELHEVGSLQHLHSDDILNRNGGQQMDNRISLREGGDAWVLRAKPRDADIIKVYAGWRGSGAASVCVSICKSSTAASVLTEVLSQLGRRVRTRKSHDHSVSRDHICCVCVSMNQTRFYVVENRKQMVQVSLLIGGLPPLLTKEDYVQLVQSHLTTKSHLVTIQHFYPSQGAVVLQISCFSEAERIFMLAKDTSIGGKTLTSLVDGLGGDVRPLLVFVNQKSGGLKGRELLYSFRKLLNPHQVFDISNGGPLAGLHTFRQVPRFRVLVCGGDGTVGWVLGVLEAVRHKLVCREPPIGIVPLGTGNDLARILRWGPGYSSEDPYHILVSVDEADEVLMDRWTILLDAQDMSEDGKDNGFLEPPKIVQMNNYFGLGIDAEVSLDFHLAREDEPDKFTSRFHNKRVYVKVGLQKISYTRSLHKELQLQVDTQNVPLPNIEGLIFLNIPSWGSGADLWGSEVDGRYGKPSIDDGLLEVVGVTGVVHMGQVQSGFRSGIRIAQGNYIRLTVSEPIPVQVDGEPWIQPPGHIIISAAGPKVRMLRKSKQKQRKSSAGVKEGRSESPSSRDGGN